MPARVAPAIPPADAAAPLDHHDDPERYLRIQEVADEIGLTTRAIRYYEEQGLLQPAARSEGSYRLFDDGDLERLRFIKGLRDDAGFSLSEIRQLLDDEVARRAVRARFRSTDDPVERRRLLDDAVERVDRQIDTLRHKAQRLAAMIDEATMRRRHLQEHIGQLDGGPDPHAGGRAPHLPTRTGPAPRAVRRDRPVRRR